jgi:hypothetical protein
MIISRDNLFIVCAGLDFAWQSQEDQNQEKANVTIQKDYGKVLHWVME